MDCLVAIILMAHYRQVRQLQLCLAVLEGLAVLEDDDTFEDWDERYLSSQEKS